MEESVKGLTYHSWHSVCLHFDYPVAHYRFCVKQHLILYDTILTIRNVQPLLHFVSLWILLRENKKPLDMSWQKEAKSNCSVGSVADLRTGGH